MGSPSLLSDETCTTYIQILDRVHGSAKIHSLLRTRCVLAGGGLADSPDTLADHLDGAASDLGCAVPDTAKHLRSQYPVPSTAALLSRVHSPGHGGSHR